MALTLTDMSSTALHPVAVGGVGGSQADFNAAHCDRRRKLVLNYVQSTVVENCRKEVLESIKTDVSFLGINL